MKRPPWGEERTTRYCRPSAVVRTEPGSTRSTRLVVSETIMSPRSPCGLTMRPTWSRGDSPEAASASVPASPSPSWRAGPRTTTGGSVVDDVDAGLDAVTWRPAAATTVRMAWATRPRRPMTRPMSSGATWMRKRIESPRSSVLMTTASGSEVMELTR